MLEEGAGAQLRIEEYVRNNTDTATAFVTQEEIVTVDWVFFEGGDVLTAGLSGFLRVGFDGEIQDVEVEADQSGDFECDIWIASYADSPPDSGDSVCDTAYPELDGAQKSQDTTLTDWTKDFKAGWWGFNVRGTPASVTQVTIGVNVKKEV